MDFYKHCAVQLSVQRTLWMLLSLLCCYCFSWLLREQRHPAAICSKTRLPRTIHQPLQASL
jgi:hypothetical protein